MSKGKKSRARHKTKFVSAGTHSNVKQSTLNAMRRDVSQIVKMEHIWNAYFAGSNPWMTLDVGKDGDKIRHKKVRMNDLHGNPRYWNAGAPSHDKNKSKEKASA